ncbi:MAG: hypothetical protein AAGF97_15900 [Planctomycetota bacterium]
MMKRKTRLTLVSAIVLVTVAQEVNAHFPWLDKSDDGKAIYFFGESPADRTYHLPEPLAKAVVTFSEADGAQAELEMQPLETDAFIGLVASEPLSEKGILSSHTTYGLFQDARLDYYAKHIDRELRTAKSDADDGPFPLSTQVIDTDSGIDVFVTWNGEPLEGVEVKLFCDEGHEEGVADTDSEGKVSFTDGQVEDGTNGLLIGYTMDESGEFEGEAYNKRMHYLTVTFEAPEGH